MYEFFGQILEVQPSKAIRKPLVLLYKFFISFWYNTARADSFRRADSGTRISSHSTAQFQIQRKQANSLGGVDSLKNNRTSKIWIQYRQVDSHQMSRLSQKNRRMNFQTLLRRADSFSKSRLFQFEQKLDFQKSRLSQIGADSLSGTERCHLKNYCT